MKKIIVTALSVITLSMMATEPNKTEHPEKYCAKMKNGKKEVMHNGMAITKEEKLTNGVKIRPDGTITKSDGTTEMLKEGECMDKDGIVMKEKDHDKDHEKKKGKSESKY